MTGNPLTLVPYDPDWPAAFVAEAGRIGSALGPRARRIEHIGSTSVPANLFRGGAAWGDRLYVIPEYNFGVDCTRRQLALSGKHTGLCWLCFNEASARLSYESNRTALWELHQRLTGLGPRGAPPAD